MQNQDNQLPAPFDPPKDLTPAPTDAKPALSPTDAKPDPSPIDAKPDPSPIDAKPDPTDSEDEELDYDKYLAELSKGGETSNNESLPDQIFNTLTTGSVEELTRLLDENNRLQDVGEQFIQTNYEAIQLWVLDNIKNDPAELARAGLVLGFKTEELSPLEKEKLQLQQQIKEMKEKQQAEAYRQQTQAVNDRLNDFAEGLVTKSRDTLRNFYAKHSSTMDDSKLSGLLDFVEGRTSRLLADQLDPLLVNLQRALATNNKSLASHYEEAIASKYREATTKAVNEMNQLLGRPRPSKSPSEIPAKVGAASPTSQQQLPVDRTLSTKTLEAIRSGVPITPEEAAAYESFSNAYRQLQQDARYKNATPNVLRELAEKASRVKIKPLA